MGDTAKRFVKNTEPMVQEVKLSYFRRQQIVCTPDSGSVLNKFRKNHQKPLDGFLLTIGIIISVTIHGSKVVDLTASFPIIDGLVTGPYKEFRLEADDKTELLKALSKKAKTEISF